MLSKAQISLIKALQHKKFRTEHGLFVVEGIKSVLEFCHSAYQVQKILATADAIAKLGKIPRNIKLEEVTNAAFDKISGLKTPQGALALVELPKNPLIAEESLHGKHTLVLDDVQDPGNLGTIIRTAEWFGIETIICSLHTVDAYNPKVVQATMGSLSRVQLYYTDIEQIIKNTSLPTFGALLNGQNIYETNFGKEGLIIMGNEGNGIRPTISAAIDTAVTIPRHGQAESLNVGIATALCCSETARRRKFQSPTMSHQTTPTIYTLQFGLLCLSSLLFSASFNMIIPELPNYLSSLGGGEHKGLIIALFTLTAGISRPFSGKLTDQWGRVPVMAVGSIVCVL